jgi:hypothetical protein
MPSKSHSATPKALHSSPMSSAMPDSEMSRPTEHSPVGWRQVPQQPIRIRYESAVVAPQPGQLKPALLGSPVVRCR